MVFILHSTCMKWLFEPVQRKNIHYLSAQVGCKVQFSSIYLVFVFGSFLKTKINFVTVRFQWENFCCCPYIISCCCTAWMVSPYFSQINIEMAKMLNKVFVIQWIYFNRSGV